MLLPLSVKLGKLRTIFEYTKSFFEIFFSESLFYPFGIVFSPFWLQRGCDLEENMKLTFFNNDIMNQLQGALF